MSFDHFNIYLEVLFDYAMVIIIGLVFWGFYLGVSLLVLGMVPNLSSVVPRLKAGGVGGATSRAIDLTTTSNSIRGFNCSSISSFICEHLTQVHIRYYMAV